MSRSSMSRRAAVRPVRRRRPVRSTCQALFTAKTASERIRFARRARHPSGRSRYALTASSASSTAPRSGAKRSNDRMTTEVSEAMSHDRPVTLSSVVRA